MSPNAKPKSVPPTSCSSCWHRSGRDALHQRHRVGRLQHLRRQRTHVTMQPQHRLTADGQVQVARLLGADGLKQFVDEQRTHCPEKPPRKRRWNPSCPPRAQRRRGLTFSYKPGVHRFVMSRLEVRTWSPLPPAHIIISVETLPNQAETLNCSIQPPTRRRAGSPARRADRRCGHVDPAGADRGGRIESDRRARHGALTPSSAAERSRPARRAG